MTGWWQNQFGDWFRDTPNASTFEKVLDRFAEDYVAGTYKTVDALEKAIDRYLQDRRLGIVS
jgi:hypothetical protein